MIRGIRGATTVEANDEGVILEATEELVKELITRNHLLADDVAQVLITVTEDLSATFPAKALRRFSDWVYVPVVCAREIPVPNSLPMCVRLLLTVNTDVSQAEIQHVYLREAKKLRPDLTASNR
ncbi:chorismate mutase [Bacillus sp. FJAT-45037]|uniref:chorismate mutase n=1 Tax=Bacillus sp. FJAT-45037 TaxID=2011007 RepID=UPI000C24169B|nr:chorismate mutase [Bacillus sp. FJAT-45037]